MNRNKQIHERDVEDIPLPQFKYYPDPVGNKSIEKKIAICPCCEKTRNFMYTASIYCIEKVDEVCPWCISDGSAAKKWKATFHGSAYSDTVATDIITEINERTPGYATWQDSRWLFSKNDAMVFLGDVIGKKLLIENNTQKIDAVLDTLNEYKEFGEWSKDNLASIQRGGQPAVYLFFDKENATYKAYNDYT